MDDFDNFFDTDGNNGNQGNTDNSNVPSEYNNNRYVSAEYYYRTPVYHTPDPEQTHPKNKYTPIILLFIVIALIMCIALVVNVIVLVSLKDEIAEQYASSLVDEIYQQYYEAVKAVADSLEIDEDIIQQITDNLNTSAAKVAGTYTIYSTVNIIAMENENASSYSSSTGFLISATSNGTTKQYIVTNAHCVLTESTTTYRTGIGGNPFGSQQQDETTVTTLVNCEYIYCTFSVGDDAGVKYSLSIVKVGSYYSSSIDSTEYKSIADLAILEFTDDAPDANEHPSLAVSTTDSTTSYGDDIAIVGYPMYEDISISDGVISSVAHSMLDLGWGYGQFYTISAAVNSGNSGGPLINSQGVVIGIVEASMSTSVAENIGYALTAETLREFCENADIGGVSLTIV